MRPFDFPFIADLASTTLSPSLSPPPSLFRFHGIRVIEFTGERMENMEEGFENVSRMELEYVFLRFVLLVSRAVYKRYVNFSGCGCVCVVLK